MAEDIAMEILQAIRYGLVDEFKCLISQVPNLIGVKGHGHSLLSQAVKMNRIEMVEELLSRGVNPCTPCDSINESVPLHIACRQGHLAMVVTLVKHGADPLQRDDDGQTAIHIAAKSGKSSIVTYFLALDVSSDVTDFAGNTSLIMAASTDGKNTTTVLALFKYGAHVNRCDYINGNTALHCAIKGGNLVAAKLLLQNEGLPDIKNKLGETAIDLIVNQKIENAERDDILLLASQNSRSFKTVNLNREWPIAAVPALIFAWTLQVLASNVSYGTKAIWILLLFGMLHFVLQNVAEVNLSRIFPVSFVLTLKVFKYGSWLKWLLPGISWASASLFLITSATSTVLCVGCLKDPGFCYTSKTQRNKNVIELSKGNMMDNKHWCSTCMMRRPLRSKHCHQCGKCVARFDHHCPFLCNCIGWKNHADFVIFLIADALASIIYLHCFTSAVDIQFGLLQLGQVHAKELYAAIVTTLECMFTLGLLVLQIYQILWLGLTTNERLNWKRYRQDFYAAYPSNKIPFDKGIVGNVSEFFGSCFNSKLTTDWNYKYNLD